MLSSLLNPKRIDASSSFYYGWIIVAVALVSMAFWLGIRSSFSVFYVALLEDFPWNRGESAGVQSMALITYTILAPLVGGLIDRFGPRRVVVPGILLLALGLLLCSMLETLTQFYLFYGVVMGSGITCIGIVTYSAILAHWFEKMRGLASGIAVSGMGLGTFLLVPLSQSFISMWGWRMTFIVTGVLVLIILLPANVLFLRHKPEEVGQCADGLRDDGTFENTCSNSMDRRSAGDDWTTKKILLSGRFWALIFFPFFSIIGIYIILVHNVRFLVDQGIDKMTAALIFAMVGVISSIFRIFWGWLSDRIGRETTFTMGILCACLGVSSLLLFENSGFKLFTYSFLIFFGMGWGVTAPMFISTAADLFRGKIFGLIYGFVEAGIGFAGALGAWVAGYIFDKTQSYHMAFILVIVVLLLSCSFIWMAAPRKFRGAGQ
ncbi:MAG: MFS transporter [Desulfobacterales bacterium]|nr:MAG: MFS transporter [Desulfobacterales bacterium]